MLLQFLVLFILFFKYKFAISNANGLPGHGVLNVIFSYIVCVYIVQIVHNLISFLFLIKEDDMLDILWYRLICHPLKIKILFLLLLQK